MAVKLWYCPDAVDMRLGFDGLFALVRNRLQADPLSGHLFIFRNRAADRLKVLYWGGHGLCLWCQRLEAGRYHFPDAPAGTAGVELSAAPRASGTSNVTAPVSDSNAAVAAPRARLGPLVIMDSTRFLRSAPAPPTTQVPRSMTRASQQSSPLRTGSFPKPRAPRPRTRRLPNCSIRSAT